MKEEHDAIEKQKAEIAAEKAAMEKQRKEYE
jgi:hypothetical protein